MIWTLQKIVITATIIIIPQNIIRENNMFRLEKVFQNDDSGFIFFVNFIKSTSLFFFSYIFIILKKYSVYDLINFQLYKNSNLFLISILVPSIYFIISFFFKRKIYYQKNFLSFLNEDLLNLLITTLLILSIILIFNLNFILDFSLVSFLIFNLIILGILKLFCNFLYELLIDKNIIQKNVMLVGTYNEIRKILKNNFDKIIIFKCCLITDTNQENLKLIKSEIKFPVFSEKDDIRSILEYHSLGQIWILNVKKNKSKILDNIFRYSVDTLNINLEETLNLKGKKLLANKYEYEFFEKSKFYGVSFFLKILIDKILSIFFLTISLPILIISAIAIYIEDGFPIIFTQNRTGWDGRRFRIYKLRSLKKVDFNKTKQVSKDDKRLLKVGAFIRNFSIDELPQFFNVIKGDMSVVGPRPHMVEHDIHYSSLFKNFLKRHKCNPGLTGWAQVNGLRGATPKPEQMEKRMEYDLWYLNNWTIWLDFYIIFKTFYALIKYRGN